MDTIDRMFTRTKYYINPAHLSHTWYGDNWKVLLTHIYCPPYDNDDYSEEYEMEQCDLIFKANLVFTIMEYCARGKFPLERFVKRSLEVKQEYNIDRMAFFHSVGYAGGRSFSVNGGQVFMIMRFHSIDDLLLFKLAHHGSEWKVFRL